VGEQGGVHNFGDELKLRLSAIKCDLRCPKSKAGVGEVRRPRSERRPKGEVRSPRSKAVGTVEG